MASSLLVAAPLTGVLDSDRSVRAAAEAVWISSRPWSWVSVCACMIRVYATGSLWVTFLRNGSLGGVVNGEGEIFDFEYEYEGDGMYEDDLGG